MQNFRALGAKPPDSPPHCEFLATRLPLGVNFTQSESKFSDFPTEAMSELLSEKSKKTHKRRKVWCLSSRLKNFLFQFLVLNLLLRDHLKSQ